MIATLGMYDMVQVRAANDRYWQAIRSALGYGPERLDRERVGWEAWQSDDLLLAQTCGLPYRARLHGMVTLVGTPDYALPGCPPGYYNSVLICRAGDPRGGDVDGFAAPRLAYNEALSQSGWAGPTGALAARGIAIGAALCCGSHAASARAVAEGRADITGIDALTWALLCAHNPTLTDALHEITRTAPVPGLPYITAAGRDAAAIAPAISAAIDGLDAQDRAALHLRALVQIPAADYLAVPTPPPPPPPG